MSPTASISSCLPNELLQEIWAQMEDKQALAELRLVSKMWASLIHPLVFRSITIYTTNHLPPSGVTTAARALTIRPLPAGHLKPGNIYEIYKLLACTQQLVTFPQLEQLSLTSQNIEWPIDVHIRVTSFSCIIRLFVDIPFLGESLLFQFVCQFSRLEVLNTGEEAIVEDASPESISALSTISLPPTLHTLCISSTLFHRNTDNAVFSWLTGTQNAALQLRCLRVTDLQVGSGQSISRMLNRFQGSLNAVTLRLDIFNGHLDLSDLTLESLFLIFEETQLSIMSGTHTPFSAHSKDCRQSTTRLIASFPSSLQRVVLGVKSSDAGDLERFCWDVVDQTLASPRYQSLNQCKILYDRDLITKEGLQTLLPLCTQRNIVTLEGLDSTQIESHFSGICGHDT